MKDEYYDKLLHIHTSGEQGLPHGIHYYRYEPTPYDVLERFFERYELHSDSRLVDFGCGKGRLNFFIHYLFHASVVGVEMNEALYQRAEENLASYSRKYRVAEEQIQFHHCLAEHYSVDPSDNCFYFFNPFSSQIFMKVVRNILRSFEATPRELDLLLYYPSYEYVYFLEHETPFELHSEMTLEELYANNPYERLMVYRLSV